MKRFLILCDAYISGEAAGESIRRHLAISNSCNINKLLSNKSSYIVSIREYPSPPVPPTGLWAQKRRKVRVTEARPATGTAAHPNRLHLSGPFFKCAVVYGNQFLDVGWSFCAILAVFWETETRKNKTKAKNLPKINGETRTMGEHRGYEKEHLTEVTKRNIEVTKRNTEVTKRNTWPRLRKGTPDQGYEKEQRGYEKEQRGYEKKHPGYEKDHLPEVTKRNTEVTKRNTGWFPQYTTVPSPIDACTRWNTGQSLF